ncbi:TIM-barrel enzyme family protein [Aspergillus chevalieri]|uniref:ToMV susceptible protein tm-1(GCR26) n=1 Tax=Aspergillus chevalieri TaxID=182096 RepID=A0A7R7VLQ5_ASPCH|nr:ToMV susceptible protein tm-1(GCR26) [Aspergillus chevalieri]BCR86879.1 ToMV susceptible protein tm-1(GCR26) [Aspergillus chevalieri]
MYSGRERFDTSTLVLEEERRSWWVIVMSGCVVGERPRSRSMTLLLVALGLVRILSRTKRSSSSLVSQVPRRRIVAIVLCCVLVCGGNCIAEELSIRASAAGLRIPSIILSSCFGHFTRPLTLPTLHRVYKMPRPTTRKEVLDSLRKTIADGSIVVGAGAGIGLSAKFIEKGGADLILIYNSGRFRMAGRGSLAGLMPYSDANQVVVEMANEVLPIVDNTPVLAGVCGTDPFRTMPEFLKQLKTIGFVGVQNFPTVGLIDGNFRANLEETGMGYEKEVEMIRIAHELDLVTTPYVFNVDEGERMARAGADVIVVHLGLTTSGTIGAQTAVTLDDGVRMVQEVRDAVVKVNPEVIVLCHGGPVAEPGDAEYVLKRTKGVHGFFGASSMERLPVERAILENAKAFKNLKV